MGPIKSVMAVYEHLQIEGTEAEDTLACLLRFRNSPAIGSVHVVAWQAQRTDQLILSGHEGQHPLRRLGRPGRRRAARRPMDLGQGPKGQAGFQRANGRPVHLRGNNFLDATEGKGELLCPLSEARHTIEVCLAISESGRRRAEVVFRNVRTFGGGKECL